PRLVALGLATSAALDMATDELSLVIVERTHDALDLETEAADQVLHHLVVLAQLFGELVDANLGHNSGNPPHRSAHGGRQGSETLDARRSGGSAAAIQEIDHARELLAVRVPQRGGVHRWFSAGERAGEAAAAGSALETGARRAHVGRALADRMAMALRTCPNGLVRKDLLLLGVAVDPRSQELRLGADGAAAHASAHRRVHVTRHL